MSLWAKQERTNVCIDTGEAVWGKDTRASSAAGKKVLGTAQNIPVTLQDSLVKPAPHFPASY